MSVSSQPSLKIQGKAPFKQSGVYETQIAIVGSRPSEKDVRDRSFDALWRANFHLRVRGGAFSETLGSSENPLPPLNHLDQVWIVVTDLFSPLYSGFQGHIKHGI